MTKKRLLFVEGLPGTGRSATGEYMAERLSEMGVAAEFFDEKDISHPVDCTFHAYIPDEQMARFSPEERREICSECERVLSGHLVPLTKLSVWLFGKALPYKIYDRLDWETERPVILERWRMFALRALENERVYVFSSSLLSVPVSETMVRFGFGAAEVREYVFEIFSRIEMLSPAVVYLRCSDIAKRLRDVSGFRSRAWLDSLVEYCTLQEYGRRRGLSGFEGCVECLEERQRVELGILEELPAERLVVDDPYGDWELAQAAIDRFLAGLVLARR